MPTPDESPAQSVAQLIEADLLSVHFQPIAGLSEATVHGHEALVRTPPGCRWAHPDALFAAARSEDMLIPLEIACVRLAVRVWARAPMSGKLFVNLSAGALLAVMRQQGLASTLDMLGGGRVAPSSLVIELTEHEQVRDVRALADAVARLRRRGICMALDDFGDGRSSLRLWSELQPELVKIDKYFTCDLSHNGSKLQTIRALLQIAETFGSQLVAEGIEAADELRIVRDLGIALGQGYFLGRPQAAPVTALEPAACEVLTSRRIAVLPERTRKSSHHYTAARLLTEVAPMPLHVTHGDLFRLFQARPELHCVALVEQDRPCGLINRQQMITSYAKPYFKELFDRRPAMLHANLTPLMLDVHTSLEDLTTVLTSSDQRYLTEGFILTEGGRYRGIGTGEQLVRMVTEARIEAARHANPLTFLPGNIPISQHIERLLGGRSTFVACYADLNHFKPFNDHYGYWRGDEMIRLLARLVVSECHAQRDFVGHVGGDDFVLLFQSDDWMQRCSRIVALFNDHARALFDDAARAAGGIHAEDRHGVMRFHPMTTLSIGAVAIEPGRYRCAEDVATAAASAKRLAKQAGLGVRLLDIGPQVAAAELT